MTTKRSGTALGLLWVAPWLIGLLLFFLLPMGMSFYYSMTDYTMLEPPLWLGLGNYTALLNDGVFWLAVRNTVIYAAVTIPLAAAVSLTIAGLLDTDHPISHIVRVLVFAPTVVPLVAAAMIWLWLFNSDHGLINAALSWVGINGPNWLQERGWAMAALIVMSVWSVGQAVVIYLAAMQDVPSALIDAASMDGLGPVRRFIYVVLPTIAPAVVFNTIIQTITAWQVFATPYIMTEGGPDRSTYFYSHYLYDQAFLFQNMGYASALGWVQLLLITACIALPYMLVRKLGAEL